MNEYNRMGIRLEAIGTVIITITALFGIIERHTMDPGEDNNLK
jgi:hypothetical protein